MGPKKAVSKEKPSTQLHVVLALPAPSRVTPSPRAKVTPVIEGKPPTSSTSTATASQSRGGIGESASKAKAIEPEGKDEAMAKAKASHPEGKGEVKAKASHPKVKGASSRVLSSSLAPVGSKQIDGTIKEGAVSDVRKRKHENIPGTQGPPEKIPKPTEGSSASVERKKLTSSTSTATASQSRGGIGESASKAKAIEPEGKDEAMAKAKASHPEGKDEAKAKAKASHPEGKDEAKAKAKASHPEGKGEAKAKASHPKVKGASSRVLSSSLAPVGSKQIDGTIKEGAMSDVRKRKHENIPGTQGPPKKIPKPTEGSGALVERKKLTSSTSTATASQSRGGIGESASKAKTIEPEGKDEAKAKAKASHPEGKGEAKAKASHPKVKGASSRVLSSSMAPVGSKQIDGTIKEGAVSDVRKRKHENIPGTRGPPEKIPKPTEGSSASVERKKLFRTELQKRDDEGVATGSSPTAEQSPRGEIFKSKRDWDVVNLGRAIQNNRVLLLKNLATGLHSADLAEAVTKFFNHHCGVRIAPPQSSSFKTTSALLKFPTASIAAEVNESMNQKDVIVSGRLVTTKLFTYEDFKPKSSTHHGHIELPFNTRDYTNEDYRDAVATSHTAQGNTIEFDYGLEWKLVDAQHEEQWRMLQEEFDSNKTTASKKME